MRPQYKILGASLLFGLIFWGIDALVDYFTFFPGSFWELLIVDVPPHELYIRSLILALFVIFGIIVSGIVTKEKKVERQLRESEEKLRLMADSLPALVSYMLPDQSFLFCNKTYESLTGLAVEHSRERTMRAVLGEEAYGTVLPYFESALAGETVAFDARFTLATGEPCDMHVTFVPHCDEHGMVRGVIALGIDVTEYKQAEKELIRQRDRAQRYLDIAGVIILGLDAEGSVSLINRKGCDILGFASEEIEGKNWCDHFVPQCWRQEVKGMFAAVTTGKVPPVERSETPVLTKDGEERIIQWHNTALTDAAGNVEGTLSSGTDITDLRRTEDLLREQLAMRDSLIEAMPGPVFYHSADNVYLGCNDAFARFIGMPKEEIVGRSVYDVRPSHLPDTCRKQDEELHRHPGFQVYESVVQSADGSQRDVIIHKAMYPGPDGRPAGIIGIILDITQRKKIERQLESNRASFTSIVENSSDGILVVDDEGTILYANSAAASMLGESVKQVVGLQFGHPIGTEGAIEVDIAAGRGEAGMALMRSSPAFWQGKPCSVVTLSDITQRRRYERALEDSEERMRSVVEESPIGINIAVDGSYQLVNPAFVKMFGYDSPAEILGRQVEELYDPEDARSIAYQELAGAGFYERKAIRKDGEPFEVSVSLSRIKVGGEPAVLGFVLDVTEERSLRAQLLQAQKMEAVGTMAGGVAHDFNNILTVIAGYTELVMAQKDPSHPEYRELQVVYDSARKGADLVHRLLTFSRKAESNPKPMDLNREVKQVVTLLSRTIPKMIEIETRLAEDLKVIDADAGQVEQVLMNLGVNARDAMPHGGKILIETRNATLDDEYARTRLEVRAGEYVRLVFSDTGCGMTKPELERIFEPFYTTKESGKGTGLGLATVYGIVKQHGGHISCYSEPGSGTTFNVYFPVIIHELKSEEKGESALPQGGVETILVVDDEEHILDLATRILNRGGYTVLTATNGLQALNIYSQEPPRVDLVVLDLIMPEMGGRACLTELLKIDPSVNVLLSSGYASGVAVKDPASLGAKGFLRKPFSVEGLLGEVRRILDEEPSREGQ